MSTFELVVKTRHGLTAVTIPAQFSFYTFGVRKDVKVCAVCPEGVAVEIITGGNTYFKRRPTKKFLAHSTVFNYYRFAAPQQMELTEADYWSGEPYLEQ